MASGTLLRGWALASQGQGEEGLALMHQGLSAHRATGAKLRRPSMLAMLAEGYGKVGQTEQGLRVLSEALALVDKTGERCWEAELYRFKGERLLALSEQNQSEAESYFHKALKVARRQQAKSWELRATMSLSRLWQRQSKRDDARQMLAKIYEWFTAGFDTPDLKEARALFEELS